MQTRSGLTLIEMIMVVSIICIVSALAIPNVKAWFGNHKLRSAATELMTTMQHARMVAVKKNAKVVVSFDPDGNGQADGNYLAFVDNGLDQKTFWTRESDEKIIKQGRVPPGIELYEASFAGGIPHTRFDPRGLPNGFGGHVYLSDMQNRYLGIHLNINGRPRIVLSRSGEKGSWE